MKKIIQDKKYGYLRIDPIPSENELSVFYREKYYKLVKKGGRAPELRKTMSPGRIAQEEIKWLKGTLYQEINYTLKHILSNKSNKLLDIGCGLGIFLSFMDKAAWDVTGIEPSEDRDLKRNSRFKIFNNKLEGFLLKHPFYKNYFDVITLINVLEHVRNPKNIIDICKKLLNPKTGYICIRVPNDFNILQKFAEKNTNKKKWWIVTPDHINYFNLNSLQKFLETNGFKVIDKTVDFPMEMFLLMGEDYTNNQKIGSVCHRKRVNFELSIPYSFRRQLYRKLAELNIGRDCILYAKLKK
jgi:SAM-dependent methyltransferase